MEKLQQALVRGRLLCTQLSIFEGSLAELLRFWCCQLQNLRKPRRIPSFLTLSSSKIKQVSQNSFVFKLADKQIDNNNNNHNHNHKHKHNHNQDTHYDYKYKYTTLQYTTLITLHHTLYYNYNYNYYYSYSYNYTTHITLHYTKCTNLHYTTLHHTTPHYTTTTRHYTTTTLITLHYSYNHTTLD